MKLPAKIQRNIYVTYYCKGGFEKMKAGERILRVEGMYSHLVGSEPV